MQIQITVTINLYASSRKFDADGGLGLEVELVASEPGQEVTLTNSGISDQHHCNKNGSELKNRHWLTSGANPIKLLTPQGGVK